MATPHQLAAQFRGQRAARIPADGDARIAGHRARRALPVPLRLMTVRTRQQRWRFLGAWTNRPISRP
ncbi:hypothetical protein ACIQXD_24955 [Streptomyces uncialis]|uniref:hypothetical protein n=1 Tax=Streptomyces uncialis TaxID=1048205 RepID=UPI003828E739